MLWIDIIYRCFPVLLNAASWGTSLPVTEHVFAIPLVYTGVPYAVHVVSNPAVVLVTTSSLDPVTVHISVTGSVGFEDLTTTVTRNQHAKIDLPPSIRLTGTGKRNATVKVTSSGVTSVHCIDNEYTGGDGFLILPVAQLGKQYYAVSYTLRVNNPSIICVSALDQETSRGFT